MDSGQRETQAGTLIVTVELRFFVIDYQLSIVNLPHSGSYCGRFHAA